MNVYCGVPYIDVACIDVVRALYCSGLQMNSGHVVCRKMTMLELIFFFFACSFCSIAPPSAFESCTLVASGLKRKMVKSIASSRRNNIA